MVLNIDKYLKNQDTGLGSISSLKVDKYLKNKNTSTSTNENDKIYQVPEYMGGGSYRGTGDLKYDELQKYRSERDVSDKTKNEVRGGSFKDTEKEVDHIVSLFLGGTDDKNNQQALQNKKSFTQTVWDVISGNDRQASEYASRQDGKYEVEKRAIEKYRNGEVGLGAARLAVLNYNKPDAVRTFLGEEKGFFDKVGDFFGGAEEKIESYKKDLGYSISPAEETLQPSVDSSTLLKNKYNTQEAKDYLSKGWGDDIFDPIDLIQNVIRSSSTLLFGEKKALELKITDEGKDKLIYPEKIVPTGPYKAPYTKQIIDEVKRTGNYTTEREPAIMGKNPIKEAATDVRLASELFLGSEDKSLYSSALTKNLLSNTLNASGGWRNASVNDNGFGDRVQKWADKDIKKLEKENAYAASTLESLSYSLTSTIPAGIAGLGASAITKSPTVGAGAAALVSGGIAYNLSTFQIMQSYLEMMNEGEKAKTGKGLTKEKEEELKKEFYITSRNYGLWEACPEALSGAIGFKLLLGPLTKSLGSKKAAETLIARLIGTYGEEVATETLTQMGQQETLKEYPTLGGKDIDWNSRTDWLEALADVAPQTVLLVTIMGSASSLATKLQTAQRELKGYKELPKVTEKIEQLHNEGGPAEEGAINEPKIPTTKLNFDKYRKKEEVISDVQYEDMFEKDIVENYDKNIIHGTEIKNIESIKSTGLNKTKNSRIGEAVYFTDGKTTSETYGDSGININLNNYKLKVQNVKELQKLQDKYNKNNFVEGFVEEYGSRYDGFIIPNKDKNVGNTYVMTNDTKLNKTEFNVIKETTGKEKLNKKKIKGYHIPREKGALKSIKEKGFDLSKFGEQSGTKDLGDPLGVYFFPDEDSTASWKDNLEDINEYYGMIESELNLNNPLKIETKKDVDKYFSFVKEATNTKAINLKEFQEIANENDSEKITKYLEKEGYDGIIDTDALLAVSEAEPQIIVFDPKNIIIPEDFITIYRGQDESIFSLEPRKNKAHNMTGNSFTTNKKLAEMYSLSGQGLNPTIIKGVIPKSKIMTFDEFSPNMKKKFKKEIDKMSNDDIISGELIENLIDEAVPIAKHFNKEAIDMNGFTKGLVDEIRVIDLAKSFKLISKTDRSDLLKKFKATSKIKAIKDTTKKQSGVGKSIKTKTLEKEITKSFEGIAEYTPIVIKEQLKQITDIMKQDIERAKRLATGKEELPEGLKGAIVIKTMEDYAMQTKDGKLALKIAQSKLITETSEAAQTLRLLAEREKDSASAKIKKLKDLRKEQIKRKAKEVKTETKESIKAKAKDVIAKKKISKYAWNNIIDEITC